MRAPICSDDVIERAFCDADQIAQAWSSAAALADEAIELEHRGVIADVARVSRRSRKQVYRWLEQHGLDAKSYRGG